MATMYNREYIYRGDIYRMENGKGVLEEKDSTSSEEIRKIIAESMRNIAQEMLNE